MLRGVGVVASALSWWLSCVPPVRSRLVGGVALCGGCLARSVALFRGCMLVSSAVG